MGSRSLFVFVCLTISTCQLGICQILHVLQDSIYESSGVHECDHNVTLPVINYDDPEYLLCKKNVALSKTVRHPDENLRVDQVILKYGYNLMTYKNITTKDGYVLTAFRITGGGASPPRSGKPAVLLFHGSGTASDEWVLQADPHKNLPFLLADAGFDVWLANSRGTDYSQGHLKLNADSELKYWDYSFHEIGIFDFPAILDKILVESKQEKIVFIGHSTAGAVYSVAMSEFPELNLRIHKSFLLAPTIFVGHSYHPIRLMTSLLDSRPRVQRHLNTMMRGLIKGSVPELRNIFQDKFCTVSASKCGVCENLLFYLYGYNPSQVVMENLPNILSKSSNTQSVKSFIHIGQNQRSCEFLKYDYGLKGNLRKYGTTQPPSYNLSNLQAPMYIYYGDGDNLVPPVDAGILRSTLSDKVVKEFKRVNSTYFNHLDFVIAKDAAKLVYQDIIQSSITDSR